MSKQDDSTEREADVMCAETYVWTDGHDWFVARDKDHLHKVHETYFGETMEAMNGERALDTWRKVHPAEKIKIGIATYPSDLQKALPEDAKIVDPLVVSATAGAWAKQKGAGHLCSLHT